MHDRCREAACGRAGEVALAVDVAAGGEEEEGEGEKWEGHGAPRGVPNGSALTLGDDGPGRDGCEQSRREY